MVFIPVSFSVFVLTLDTNKPLHLVLTLSESAAV